MNQSALFRHSLWVFSIALILGLLSFYFFDQPLSQFLNQDFLYRFRRVCRYVTDLGEGGPYFAGSLLLYVFARWVAPRLPRGPAFQAQALRVRAEALFFFLTLVVIGLFTQILKIMVGRQRPHKSPTFENFYFEPINLHWHWHSFPSGHSQLVFSVATMVVLMKPRWRWPVFLIAALVALTRVSTHHHFLSDVIAGSAIGYLGALWMNDWLVRKWPSLRRPAT